MVVEQVEPPANRDLPFKQWNEPWSNSDVEEPASRSFPKETQ